MNIRKGMVAGLGIAGLLIALPAGANEKSRAGSSGSSSASDQSSTAGGSSSTDHSTMGGSSGTMGGSSGTMGGTSAGGAASAGGAQHEITGKVDKVDESKKQLSLQLKVDENTQVTKNGQKATLSDIKQGDQVRASFSGSQVQRIDVMSSGAAEPSTAPRGAAPGAGSSGAGGTAPGSSGPSNTPGRGY